MRLPELGGSKVKVDLRLSVSVLNFHGFLLSFSLLATCATCIFVLHFLQLTVKSIKLFSFYLSFTTGTIALLKARLLCTSQFYFFSTTVSIQSM